MASKDFTKPLGARKHQPSRGEIDVQKLRKLTAATLEAALRIKEARKQCFLEETEQDFGLQISKWSG